MTTPVFGLTPSGLTIKRLADLRQDLRDAIANSSAFGVGAETGPEDPLGVLIDLVSVPLANVNSLAQALYDSFVPANAEGVALDNNCSIVGVTRLDETKSVGEVTLGGTAATVVPVGSQCRIPNGAVFVTTEAGIIPATVEIEAVEAGPIDAIVGAIDTIVTPVAGWTSVTNAAAIEGANVGRDVETDSALRVRRERDLAAAGSTTDAAIRADLNAIETVVTAIVLSNRELVDDVYGTPGKAFLTVIWPNTADQDEIAEVLWQDSPAGIKSWGTDISKDVTDSEGNAQTVRWNWAAEQVVYITAIVGYDATKYPADGDDLLEAAIVAEGEYLTVGDDVLLPRFAAACAERTDAGLPIVPGIKTLVIRAKIGGVPGAGDIFNLTISAVQIATVASANVLITSSPV